MNAFIPPSDFQIESEMEVEGNKIIISLQSPLKYNHTYSAVVTDKVKSLSGKTLPQTEVLTFSSEYRPLYAHPLELRSVIKDLYTYFSLDDLYASIRDASQKAHQLQGMESNPNSTRFQIIQENAASYFPTTKFVVYEASRSLISSFLANNLYRKSDRGQEDVFSTDMDMTLGDFSVKGFSEESSGNASGANQDKLVDLASGIVEEIERNLKFWQDAMMGRNGRGYASPISAAIRSAVEAPAERGF